MKNNNDVVLIPLKGMEDFTNKVKNYMVEIAPNLECRIISVEIPRFATGDAKAVLQNSVRGKDVFVLVDVGFYDCEFRLFDKQSYMSPDDHFQDLVRTISAIGGKAARVNVVSPLLYAARQDRRFARESLDCAVALQHLESIGVANVMAFDVHDDRVMNATPFMGFDKLMPTYQMIKALRKNFSDIIYDENHLAVVSPDFGGISRNYVYANELNIDMGVFYKRRSTSKFKDGKYDVEVHKYIGPELDGLDVLIADDIIASGDTILDTAKKVKEYGAKRVFLAVTFGFFTNGLDGFSDAYKDGIIDAVLITNATYRRPELLACDWYKEVDIIKYTAYYIYCVTTGESIAAIIDSHQRIQSLFEGN